MAIRSIREFQIEPVREFDERKLFNEIFGYRGPSAPEEFAMQRSSYLRRHHVDKFFYPSPDR